MINPPVTVAVNAFELGACRPGIAPEVTTEGVAFVVVFAEDWPELVVESFGAELKGPVDARAVLDVPLIIVSVA